MIRDVYKIAKLNHQHFDLWHMTCVWAQHYAE